MYAGLLYIKLSMPVQKRGVWGAAPSRWVWGGRSPPISKNVLLLSFYKNKTSQINSGHFFNTIGILFFLVLLVVYKLRKDLPTSKQSGYTFLLINHGFQQIDQFPLQQNVKFVLSVDISNMGKNALDSHEKSKKHQSDIIAFKSPNPIQS